MDKVLPTSKDQKSQDKPIYLGQKKSNMFSVCLLASPLFFCHCERQIFRLKSQPLTHTQKHTFSWLLRCRLHLLSSHPDIRKLPSISYYSLDPTATLLCLPLPRASLFEPSGTISTIPPLISRFPGGIPMIPLPSSPASCSSGASPLPRSHQHHFPRCPLWLPRFPLACLSLPWAPLSALRPDMKAGLSVRAGPCAHHKALTQNAAHMPSPENCRIRGASHNIGTAPLGGKKILQLARVDHAAPCP